MAVKTGVKLRNSILLVIASVVWGFAFAAQSIGSADLGTYSFNGVRMLLGGLVVFAASFATDKAGLSKKPQGRKERRTLIITGTVCGFLLCIACNLQQAAITLGASSGKAGFLTAMYIILVPVIGLFLHRKCGLNVWIAVAAAIGGLYLLCIKESFSLSRTDILLILCAFVFAVQITVIDRYGIICDSIRLSYIEFLSCGIMSMIPAVIFEIIPTGSFAGWLMLFTKKEALISILYMVFLSCAVGYTLQIVGQKGLNPTIASLLMSLEAVFSLLAGWLVLHQSMSIRELSGCALMFASICISQIRFNKKEKKKDNG